MQGLDAAIAPILIASLLSMAAAQFVKPFVDLLYRKPWRLSRMFDTGGMPSSHTALVTMLTLGIGTIEGTSTTVFSVVLIFSLYFVFEATGLRQEVGQQARILNELVDELVETHHVDPDPKRLRELVGHTWTEVVGGGAVGVVVFFLTKDWLTG